MTCPDPETLLEQFDRAWQAGPPPRIENYLPYVTVPILRRQFLEELIAIDLEYRWRHGSGNGAAVASPGCGPIGWCPRLEDYVRAYPEMTKSADMSVELIVEEYLARRRWGNRPGHDEYLSRYPRLGAELQERLPRADAALEAEFAGGNGLPPLCPEVTETTDRRPAQVDAAALIEQLRDGALLDRDQLNQLPDIAQGRTGDARMLARQILQKGWLTPYQLNQALLGRASQLILGPYLLLQRLGEGGAGQVFKAKHRQLDRVVALKLLRRELLTDPEVVARFYREIRVVSRCDHPNIVHAYDAGPIGPAHALALEYLPGTDLGRLVRQTGPLPVTQAADYVRQAALGLQHAHENGLVHRDVRPHNLLLSFVMRHSSSAKNGAAPEDDALPTIKIVDLGLARLHRTGPGDSTTLQTPQGTASMMGTPDYMAPEQALDFHGADIRADIYSLGCTLYHLLTGQPPFHGTNLAEKLLRHQQAEPPPVESVRPDVPPSMAAVLRRMMAKRPDDRYQTPAAVAAALEPFAALPQLAVQTPRPVGQPVAATASGGLRSPFFDGNPRCAQKRGLYLAALVVLLALSVSAYWALFKGGAQPLAPAPALVVHCGKAGGKQQDAVVRPGYSYRVLRGGIWNNPRGPTTDVYCWADPALNGSKVHFELNLPPATAGTLRLGMVCVNQTPRKLRVEVQNRWAGDVELKPYPAPGHWVEVPVASQDSKGGKVEVAVRSLSQGINAILSEIEFVPLPLNPP